MHLGGLCWRRAFSASAGLGPRRPSHALGIDCVVTGRGGQVGSKDHPQGTGGVAQRGLLRTAPISHQPHKQLVGPGDAKGRSNELRRGPEAGDGPALLTEPGPPCCPSPTALPTALLTLAVWSQCPAPPQLLSPGRSDEGQRQSFSLKEGVVGKAGRAAHLVDAEHWALEDPAQPV